jgi:hypothetical protein
VQHQLAKSSPDEVLQDQLAGSSPGEVVQDQLAGSTGHAKTALQQVFYTSHQQGVINRSIPFRSVLFQSIKHIFSL